MLIDSNDPAMLYAVKLNGKFISNNKHTSMDAANVEKNNLPSNLVNEAQVVPVNPQGQEILFG